jgi:hypothetical protein
VQEPGKNSIINRFPPAAIGRVLTADSIHREQQHDSDDDDLHHSQHCISTEEDLVKLKTNHRTFGT